MLNIDQEKKLEIALAEHQKRFVAHPFKSDVGSGVYWTDLSRRPAKVKVMFKYEETPSIYGFGFTETTQSTRLDLRKKSIEEFIESVAGAGTFDQSDDSTGQHPIPFSKAVRDFGLFNQEAMIGAASYDSFIQSLEVVVSKADFKAIESEVDPELFKRHEESRLRHPFSYFSDNKVHQSALNIASRIEAFDWDTLSFYGKNDANGVSRRQAAEIYPMFADYFAHHTVFSRHVIQKQKPLNSELSRNLGIKEKALKRFQKIDWPANGLSIEEIAHHSDNIPLDWFPKTREDWDSFCILTKTVGKIIGSHLTGVSENPFDALYKGAKGNWREFHERCSVAFFDDRPPEGMDPEKIEEVVSVIKKDRKNLAKAARKGEDDFSSQLSRTLGKFAFPSAIDEQQYREWAYNLHHPNMSEDFMIAACEATLELVEFVRDHVVVPAAANRVRDLGNITTMIHEGGQKKIARETALRLIAMPDRDAGSTGKSTPALFEAARYFSNDYAAIAEKALGFAPDVSKIINIPEGHWVPAFNGEVELGNGIYAVVCDSPKSLKEEGKNGTNKDETIGNSHCVGGYNTKCVRHAHQIVSFRRRLPTTSPAFERLGTLELGPIPFETTELDQRQFYARGNTRPADSTQAAKELLFMKIRSGDVSLNHDGMRQFKEAHGNLERDNIEVVCQYDWRKEDLITQAMMAVGRFIHPSFTKGQVPIRNATDLGQHPVMKDMISSMDAVYGMENDFQNLKSG